MTIELTDSLIKELEEEAQEKGEQIHQKTELGSQIYFPQTLGEGSCLYLNLHSSLQIEILRYTNLKQNIRRIRQHESNFPLTAKFYLTGGSRIQTLDATDIDTDYEEIHAHHYLYHLPNHTEVEEWTDRPAYVVYVYASLDYFTKFNVETKTLPESLQKLLAGDTNQRFHQPLGKINSSIKQLLEQILYCPYIGLMRQIYLEAKVLEIFAVQFALWEETPAFNRQIFLSTSDIEQLHQAKQMLIEQIERPPSLNDLARQVRLNEYKLKLGFRHLFGTTVFGYLRQYRLEQAKKLLHDQNLTIANIALKVGYKSPESFCKAFRRQFAVSPKTYQLSQRK